jgi:hypothetical protein
MTTEKAILPGGWFWGVQWRQAWQAAGPAGLASRAQAAVRALAI